MYTDSDPEKIQERTNHEQELAEELEFECEQCAIIREEIEWIYQADGLTYTQSNE